MSEFISISLYSWIQVIIPRDIEAIALENRTTIKRIKKNEL